MSDTSFDDVQLFIDEEDDKNAKRQPEQGFWQVLIVDDDDDVHRATEFALADVMILNRKLKFIHTFSKQESLQVMRQSSNIAVILLDVVMETECAGLELVNLIRNELNWQDTRIILRTGQPGYAPEEDAIRDYDINDYKTKNELTRKKLLTALTSAIRSYDQIRKIEHNRRGLHQIISANANVSVQHGMQIFATKIIEQVSIICGVPPEGLLLAQSDEINHIGHSHDFSVIAATGQYQHWMNCLIEEIAHSAIGGSLKQALTNRQSSFGKDNMTLFLPDKAIDHSPHLLNCHSHCLKSISS